MTVKPHRMGGKTESPAKLRPVINKVAAEQWWAVVKKHAEVLPWEAVFQMGHALGLEFSVNVKSASGTSGSAQDPQGLDPKGAGPTAESGNAQNTSVRPTG